MGVGGEVIEDSGKGFEKYWKQHESKNNRDMVLSAGKKVQVC